MLKKLVLVLILTLQFAMVAQVGTSIVPMPDCFPCGE
jgi:hypothetical protein